MTYMSCTSHTALWSILSPSLIENGGIIGQDKEGEAYFYSVLYFGV